MSERGDEFMLCDDCKRPIYYDETREIYRHAVEPERGCFLIPAESVDVEADDHGDAHVRGWIARSFERVATALLTLALFAGIAWAAGRHLAWEFAKEVCPTEQQQPSIYRAPKTLRT